MCLWPQNYEIISWNKYLLNVIVVLRYVKYLLREHLHTIFVMFALSYVINNFNTTLRNFCDMRHMFHVYETFTYAYYSTYWSELHVSTFKFPIFFSVVDHSRYATSRYSLENTSKTLRNISATLHA